MVNAHILDFYRIKSASGMEEGIECSISLEASLDQLTVPEEF